VSIGEYRESLDHARVKMAPFLVGGAEDTVKMGGLSFLPWQLLEGIYSI